MKIYHEITQKQSGHPYLQLQFVLWVWNRARIEVKFNFPKNWIFGASKGGEDDKLVKMDWTPHFLSHNNNIHHYQETILFQVLMADREGSPKGTISKDIVTRVFVTVSGTQKIQFYQEWHKILAFSKKNHSSLCH